MTQLNNYIQHILRLSMSGRGAKNITSEIEGIVKESGISVGICHVFIQHTSASLMVCENADPDVYHDLEKFMLKLVPDGDPMFIHTSEGEDDMPAHVRSILTQTELTLPIQNMRLALGTWQGIFVWEHRLKPHHRQLVVTLHGQK